MGANSRRTKKEWDQTPIQLRREEPRDSATISPQSMINEIRTKRDYQIPVFKRSRFDWMFDPIKKGWAVVCRQCSGCHGCR